MNSCRKNEKRIAWFALQTLEAKESKELQAHLEVCPRCRRRWEATSAVCHAHLAAGRRLGRAAAGDRFHERLVRRMRKVEVRAPLSIGVEVLRAWFAAWGRATVLVVLALIALALFAWPHARSPEPHVTHAAKLPATPHLETSEQELEPTMAHYQWALDTSLENFDALLARQTLHAASPSVTPAIGTSLEVGSEN